MFHIYETDGKKRDRKGKIIRRFQAVIDARRNGLRFYKTKTFSTKREAESWATELIRGIDSGFVTKEGLRRRTLSEAISMFLENVLPTKPKNARKMRQHLRWWNDRLGGTQLAAINREMLSDARDFLLSEKNRHGEIRSGSTVRRYFASLSGLFQWAIRNKGWITLNPVRLIDQPPGGKPRARVFSLEELEKIYGLCQRSKNPHVLLLFLIGLHTSLRRGNILALRWSDIDLNNRLFVIAETKNGSPQNVPISETCFELISELHKERNPDPDDCLFPSKKSHKIPADPRSPWEQILKQLGIHDAVFHDLRRSVITLLASKGFNTTTIQRLSGHSGDGRVLERVYTHLYPEAARAMVAVLDQITSRV